MGGSQLEKKWKIVDGMPDASAAAVVEALKAKGFRSANKNQVYQRRLRTRRLAEKSSAKSTNGANGHANGAQRTPAQGAGADQEIVTEIMRLVGVLAELRARNLAEGMMLQAVQHVSGKA